MTKNPLALVPSDVIPVPPPDRGRLLDAREVATIIGGKVSAVWVRRWVPNKVVLGHSTVRWYELDVRAWLETQRGATFEPRLPEATRRELREKRADKKAADEAAKSAA